MELENFVQQLKDNNIEITVNPDDIHKARRNVTGYTRQILAIIYPKSTEQVQTTVRLARKYKIPLYPISRGKNIGLGSKLPINRQAAIVSLEKMDRIIKVNQEFGTATIEPGVTQQQMYEYLNSINANYYLDVTGAPAGSSIIGNILEKGVTYNTIRFNAVISFEVVLGTGEILKTGYAHYKNTPLADISKYAPGPSLTELFIQSNFGIVTKAIIKLNPKTEQHTAFTLSLYNEQQIGEIIEKIRYLKQQKVINTIVHIGNHHRTFITAAPMVYRYLKSHGMEVSRQTAENLLEKFLPGGWSLIASLSGPKQMVKAAKKIVKKTLSQYGKIAFIDQKKIRLAQILSKTLGLKKLNIYLNSISPLTGFTFGRPSDEALHSIYWPHADENPLWRDPDQADFGFVFIVPVSPLRKAEVDKTLQIIKQIEQQFGFKLAVTLNPVDEFILEGVVSFDFDLKDQQQVQKAHKAIRTAVEKFVKAGLIPYRVDINNYDLLIDPDDIYWQKIRDLKQVFDPDNIISPKRYNLI